MKRAALIIGINRYDDPEIQDLTCAESDARELWGLLKHKAGYDDVRYLPAPTTEQVLELVGKMISGLSFDDFFLLYFAGHGVEYGGHHLLLCPKVKYSRIEYMQQTIPVDLLKDETSKEGIHRVFILDACRSDLLRTRAAKPDGFRGTNGLRDIVASKTPETGALVILCSCDEGQQACEIAARNQGLFTGALLEVLAQSIVDGRPACLSNEFIDSLAQNMKKMARHYGISSNQRPWIMHSGTVPTLLSCQYRSTAIPNTGASIIDGAQTVRGHQTGSPQETYIESNKHGVTKQGFSTKGVESSPSPIASASLIYRTEDSLRHNIVICAGTSFGFGRDESDPRVDVVLHQIPGKDKEAHRFISRNHFRILHDKELDLMLLKLTKRSPSNDLFVNDMKVDGMVILKHEFNTVELTGVMNLFVECRSTESTIHLLLKEASKNRHLPNHQYPSSCCLVRHAGQDIGTDEEIYILLYQSATIGSDPRNAIHMQASGVVPLHAVLFYSDGQLLIERKSDAGMVCVNEKILRLDSRVPLSYGDRLKIGSIKARLIQKRFLSQ